jgi:hypothetical protein
MNEHKSKIIQRLNSEVRNLEACVLTGTGDFEFVHHENFYLPQGMREVGRASMTRLTSGEMEPLAA